MIVDTANQDYTAFAVSFCGRSFFSDYGNFVMVEVHEYDPKNSSRQDEVDLLREAGERPQVRR